MTTTPKLTQKSAPLPLEAIVLGLLIVLYAPLLWHWVDGWLNKSISIQHEYFSHGLLGIPFAAYLVWSERGRWQGLSNRMHPAGGVLLAGALLLYSSGLVDLMNLSLPVMLAALCLIFKAFPGLRLQAFPLVLVTLSTPTQLPYLIEPYILPLQRFIATVAAFILQQLGIEVQVRNIYLTVNEQLVEVAPHCAGLKMLFTSLFMGLILAYWTGLYLSKLRTGIFFVGILAVSVIGNILRNTILTFFHGNQMDSAFHWLHESWGGDLYSAAMLGSLVVLVQLLLRFVPERVNLSPVPETFAPPAQRPQRPVDF
ncbi:MAG: cyanoexosortase B [Cyanobacteria bacterium J06648_16]